MKHRSYIYVAVVAAVVLAAVFLYWRQTLAPAGIVTIGDDIVVSVEVANTPRTHEQGLSGHAPLGPNEGMLFLFPDTKVYAFWMKDMLFPIDIIWIREGRIVDITTDVAVPVEGQELQLYRPIEVIDTVLEVKAGFAREHGLKLGLPVKVEAVDRKSEVQ